MSDATTNSVLLGNEVVLTVTSEWEGTKRCDTHIKIGEDSLCWVSGAECGEFITKLQNLVNEYRI